MKRILLLLVGAALFAPALQAVSSFQAPTPDAVIEKYLAAMGGRDALGKLTSRRATGTVLLSSGGNDLNGTYEVSTKAPNKVRVQIKLDLTPMGMPDPMVIDQRFDGATAMNMNSMQGNTPIAGSQLEHMKNNAFPSPLFNYKTNGMKFEVLPKEQVGGRDAIALVATPKTGPSMKLYFDPDSGLLVRSVVRLNVPEQGEIEQVSEPSDYRAVDGVKVPHKIVNTSPNQTVTITITKVENNVALDDAIFVSKGL
jgi:outer membrane lipoprotein-sorting protein